MRKYILPLILVVIILSQIIPIETVKKVGADIIGGIDELRYLLDVNFSSPVTGNVITYNSTQTKWVNANVSSIYTETDPVATALYINTTSPITGGGQFSSSKTIAIPKATSSADGYLNQTDWTTFNNKQPALTGSISGTSNQVIVSANSNSVASSITLSLPQSINTTSSPTFVNVTESTPTLLKLDQTTPQSIINGIPLMTGTVDIDGSTSQLVNKDYVDTALLGLELTEFFSTVNSATSDGVGGYYKIMDNTVQIAGTNTSGTLTTGDNQYYRGYITPVGSPGLTTLYAGAYNIRGNLYKTGTKSVVVYFKLYQRTTGGVETLIATSDNTAALTTVATPFNIYMYLSSNYSLSSTDRLVLKAYANVGASGGDVTIKTDVGGSTSAGLTIRAPAVDVESLATAISFSCIAGEVLKKGQVVYISGASSGLPQVSKADNTSTTKCRVVGCITEDLGNGAVGKVRRTGILVSVDTTTSGTGLNVNPNGETWTAGTLLFATTGGGMTNVRPTSGRSVKAAYTLLGNSATDTLLVYPFENPVWHTGASGEDNVLRLGDNIGVNKVSIRDYANNEVASVNSDGNSTFNSATITGLSGIVKATAGLLSSASAGSDYENPLTFSDSLNRATNTITLDNDNDTPGNSTYYGTNSTGTKGFFPLSASSGATTALDNLASVAINTGLVSDTANTDDLGTEALYWKKLYLASDISFEGSTDDNYQTTLSAVDPTADITIYIPKADGTMAVSATAPVTLSALGDIGLTVAKDLVTTSPLAGGTDNILPGADGDVTLSIADAVADGSTKGAATFVANDFTSSSGTIGLDYPNGQVANATQHGFLSDVDWGTFNGKADAKTDCAFLVTGGTQNDIATDTNVTIVFNTEVFDLGNNFNTSTYTFTSPVTGKYQLSFNLELLNVDSAATSYYIEIVTSNRTYSTFYDLTKFSGDLGKYSFTASVLADMDINDTAYVRVYQTAGTAQMDLYSYSWFSGYLET